MKESKEFYWAEAASGFIDYVNFYYDLVGTRIFNLHFRYWAEALNKFQQINESNFKVEELLIILNFLCQSLETLAGVSIKPRKRTPQLLTMYKKSLKDEMGWDMPKERPDLFKNLKDMSKYHNNLCKHINRSDSRKELLSQISYKKIRKYMATTKEIWLWILNKKFNGEIPANQLVLFEFDFY